MTMKVALSLGVMAATLFAFLFLAPSPASAIVLDHEILMEAESSGLVHATVKISYDTLDSDKAFYLVFGRIGNVRAEDARGPVSCTTEGVTGGTQIICTPNVADRINYQLQLRFDVLDLVARSDSKQIFNYKVSIAEQTRSFKFGFRLPEGMVLVEPAKDAYLPANAVLGTTGRRVTLDWDMRPELGQSHIFFVRYEPPFGFPVPVSFDYLYVVLAVVIALIAYFWIRAKKSTRTEAIISVLNQDERKVLEAIADIGEKCKQRDVVKKTAFSKAKVSRILTALEKRGIIKKEQLGRTNRIILKEKKLLEEKKKKGSAEF